MLPHSRSCCQGSLLTSRMCKVCGYRFAGPSRCLLFAAIPLLLPIFLHRLARMQPMQVTVNLRCLLRLPFCVLFELSCALQQQACFCILSFEGLVFALGFALSLLALVLTLCVGTCFRSLWKCACCAPSLCVLAVALQIFHALRANKVLALHVRTLCAFHFTCTLAHITCLCTYSNMSPFASQLLAAALQHIALLFASHLDLSCNSKKRASRSAITASSYAVGLWHATCHFVLLICSPYDSPFVYTCQQLGCALVPGSDAALHL